MENNVSQEIINFLNKCDEIKKCKFIMAPTKIKDLLKCIVNSAELHQLFTTVTRDFDYLAAKNNCFVTTNDGMVTKSYVVLPNTVGDRLAFIFCLFVEFDRDSINFNNFLRKYYYEDGSYYASYQSFCESVVGSLQKIIEDIYAKELAAAAVPQTEEEQPEPQPVDGGRARTLSAISLTIASEKQYIFESPLPKDDKESGLNMLTELEKAVKEGKWKLVEALVCGYNYYILYNNVVSDVVSSLFELILEYGSSGNEA